MVRVRRRFGWKLFPEPDRSPEPSGRLHLSHDLAAVRHARLQESALLHVDAARRARQEGDFASTIRDLRVAHWRNPELAEAGQLLEEVRLEIARLSALQFADERRGVNPRAPAQVQLQRRLLLAEQYLNDGKQAEAE